MNSPAQKILQRFDNAKKRRIHWERTYKEAQEYIAPQRETFYDLEKDEKGDRKDGSDDRIFDSTAISALYRFQNNIQSSLVPPMRRWVDLVPGMDMPDNKQTRESLRDITKIMFDKLGLSNFDTQIAESFLDLGFGTGAFLLHKGTRDSPFEFVNVPLSQLYLEEGPNGKIDTAFRKFKLTYRNIPKQWPDANLSKELNECVQESPDKEAELVEATIPSKIMVYDAELDQEVEVNGYVYYVVETQEKEVLVKREMRSSPWIIFRWANLPGEIYGRGPALTALPDVKSLNKTKELLLKAASIATYGMYTLADDGIVNFENIKFGPGAIIPVSSNPGGMQGPTLAPLGTPGNPNLSQIIIEELRASINEMLFGDPLGDVNNPVKTATEISLRQQNLAKRIGSAFGKLQFELIAPLVNRMLFILDDLGVVDLAGFKADGGSIKISHVSPLAQAQSEEEIVQIQRYAETVITLFGPQNGLALMNPDKFAMILADKMNIDPSIPISQEDADKLRQALQQQAAQGNIGVEDVVQQ